MRSFILAAALTAAYTPTLVAAQGEREEEARALFDAGRTAFENGHFADALERFRVAHELSGRSGLLFNIGAAAERLRRDEEAIEAFEAYLEAEPDAENAAQVRARLVILREGANRRGSEPAPERAPPDDGPVIAGWVISGIGLVGLGIGWGFFGELLGAMDGFRADPPSEPGFLTRQARLDDAETAVYFTGLIGGAVLTAGLPLLLPEEEGVPLFAWLLGGLGVAVAGGGIAALAIESECLDQACTRREPYGALGGLLLGHAAPLMAVPIVYLLREATGSSEVSAQASASADGAWISVGGAL